MSTKNIEAIILGRRNMGEADRLLLAYSKEEGKVKIIAKGSRKIKSRLASHIEPFTIGKYHLVIGKTFYILAGAEAIRQNRKLSEDLEAYQDASYLCELLDLATAEGENNLKLYEVAKYILSTINDIRAPKRAILLRYLEFIILESSGYKPSYHKCIKCDQKLCEQEYYYGNFEGVHCEKCNETGRKITKNAFKILRMFERGDIEEIVNIKDVEKHSHEVQEVILPSLYDILPRKPKSLEI